LNRKKKKRDLEIEGGAPLNPSTRKRGEHIPKGGQEVPKRFLSKKAGKRLK